MSDIDPTPKPDYPDPDDGPAPDALIDGGEPPPPDEANAADESELT